MFIIILKKVGICENYSLRDSLTTSEGLRKVVPYQFVYQTYVKGRWEGRPIIETFAKEFQDKPRKYYVGTDWHSSPVHDCCSQ